MFTRLIREDLELRLLDYPHLEEIFESVDYSRETLREWLPWVDHTVTSEDTKNFIAFTKKQYAANEGFQAGIWFEGQFAGIIGYHGLNWANRSVCIGYWLDDRFIGKGIMTRACREFVNYAFAEMKLNRVEIRCGEHNLRSRSIPARLGFTAEGVIRDAEWINTRYVDHVVYGMLAREFSLKCDTITMA